MQLAQDLHMTRKKLLSELDSPEISDWIAFHMIKNENSKKTDSAQTTETDQNGAVLQAKFKSILAGKIKKRK